MLDCWYDVLCCSIIFDDSILLYLFMIGLPFRGAQSEVITPVLVAPGSRIQLAYFQLGTRQRGLRSSPSDEGWITMRGKDPPFVVYVGNSSCVVYVTADVDVELIFEKGSGGKKGSFELKERFLWCLGSRGDHQPFECLQHAPKHVLDSRRGRLSALRFIVATLCCHHCNLVCSLMIRVMMIL